MQAVGPTTAAISAAGHFANSSSSRVDHLARYRADSEGLFYPEESQVLSPHLLQQQGPGPGTTTPAPGAKKQAIPYTTVEEEVCVSMHRLNTESSFSATQGEGGGRGDKPSSHHHHQEAQPGSYGYSSSPSLSPLPEPAFEPYVYCTKTRSETSYSNESQFSNSSSERGDCAVVTTTTTVVVPDTRVPDPAGPATPPSGGHHLHHHRPLSRQAHSVSGITEHQEMSPLSTREGEGGGEGDVDKDGVTMLISPHHDAPQALCETKPVLPPSKVGGEGLVPSSPLYFPSVHRSPADSHEQFQFQASPPSSKADLLASLDVQHSKAVTLLQKVGQEGSKFSADYLGAKDVDMYTRSINTVAKELAAAAASSTSSSSSSQQRPRDIHVLVTPERVRLTPPHSATLFRSFPVRDILLVRKCSKNKRIIGVMVWKQRGGRTRATPTCHILRCQDNLVAGALYDALWQQTQKVDEVSSEKVRRVGGTCDVVQYSC